ncbi:MAG: hypothetical protein H0U59_02695 [Gemmatimonadaceae bacterium]|nr:hypothetical protein [Gemmatimonadaceae bacterium]
MKLGARDKQFSDHKLPGSDVALPADRFPDPFGGAFGGARPFIFATPHHVSGFVNETQMMDPHSQYDAAVMQLEQAIQDVSAQLESLHQQYQQVLEEYQRLTGGG